MKTFYIFLTILSICSFNLFSQHYIGQDKLDQLRESEKSNDNIVDIKSTNFEVYLESASKENGYASDVMVGFDKLKYLRGEKVTLTFKRTGRNSKVENEKIAIVGKYNVLGDGFEILKTKSYSIFYLKPNEIKRVFIQLRNKNQLIDRISMGIGRMGIESEGRGYIIPYSPPTNEIDNKNDSMQVKPEWRYYNQNNDQNNGTQDFYLHRQNPSNII